MKAKDKIICSPDSKMNGILKRLAKIPDDKSILLTGPTGTGKELLADYIHENSQRSKRPFTKLNCTGLTDTMMNSELFGHEKGAYTDAIKERIGLIEESADGILFLDEIANMPWPSQAKLLRVLENGTFHKLGKNKELEVQNVKFIAATNKPEKLIIDLKERFQYHEETEPLHERPTDIPYLLKKFFENTCFTSVDLPTLLCLSSMKLEGNVRALQRFVNEAELSRKMMIDEGSLVEGSLESTTLLFHLYYNHLSDPTDWKEQLKEDFGNQSRMTWEEVSTMKESFSYFNQYILIRKFTSFDTVACKLTRSQLCTIPVNAWFYRQNNLEREFYLQIDDEHSAEFAAYYILRLKDLLSKRTQAQLNTLVKNPKQIEIGLGAYGTPLSLGVTLKEEYLKKHISVEDTKVFGVPWDIARERFHRAYVADLLKIKHSIQKELFENFAKVSKSTWHKWKMKFPDIFDSYMVKIGKEK